MKRLNDTTSNAVHTHQEKLKSHEAHYHGKERHLSKHDHRKYSFQLFAIFNKHLMLLHAVLQLHITNICTMRQIFFIRLLTVYFILDHVI